MCVYVFVYIYICVCINLFYFIFVIDFNENLPVPPFISFPPTALVTLRHVKIHGLNTCHIRHIYFVPLVVMELLSLSDFSPGNLHRFFGSDRIIQDRPKSASGHHRIPPETAASDKKVT